VVADAEVGVGLDLVASELAEDGPALEEPRVAAHDRGHGLPAVVVRLPQRRLEGVADLLRLRVEHGLAGA
jgi:hypothetical protein